MDVVVISYDIYEGQAVAVLVGVYRLVDTDIV
jgi:hypothetical protein